MKETKKLRKNKKGKERKKEKFKECFAILTSRHLSPRRGKEIEIEIEIRA